MWKGGGDLESAPVLYPGIPSDENVYRWAFIRKVYCLLLTQILLTVVVSAVVVFYHPVAAALTSSPAILIVLCILPFVFLCPLFYYHQQHPLNLLLLGLFTVCISLTVGIVCAYTEGRIVLEALILTAGTVLGLTLYTFWAAKRGYDFNFLGPMLSVALMVLILFCFIQLLFPLGPLSLTIYGALAAILFSFYIIYDTDNLIKRYDYDQYIWASVALYLDILNLFLAILDLLRGIQGR
ncbi:hypothetical protein GOP47_0019089 [Adiantum capillus-veneris]|uniref:BI1-like protein n=1 Tax=Adiantum capillus-veneris TaxID=13818 RepID=A0A9D4UER2_ADICA|nr:hypothetical protein GOP47_0019089 [Adiantum capillus-veneris]